MSTAQVYFRTPTIDNSVSLDEFDTDDIIKYLRYSGYEVEGSTDINSSNEEGCHIPRYLINRIETLALCGQKEHAREMICKFIGDTIGRSIL